MLERWSPSSEKTKLQATQENPPEAAENRAFQLYIMLRATHLPCHWTPLVALYLLMEIAALLYCRQGVLLDFSVRHFVQSDGPFESKRRKRSARSATLSRRSNQKQKPDSDVTLLQQKNKVLTL
jgi:hypothetical protein